MRSGMYVSFSVSPTMSSPMSIGVVASVLGVGSTKSTLAATIVSSTLAMAEGRTDLNYGVGEWLQKPVVSSLCLRPFHTPPRRDARREYGYDSYTERAAM